MNDEKNPTDTKQQILQLICFSDAEFDSEFVNLDIDPEQLLENLGLSTLELDDLLELLEFGACEIEDAVNVRLFEKRPEAFHRIGLRFGCVALAIYEKLFQEGIEPRISTSLAANRHQATNCSPSCVLFWADVDAIRGLYLALKADGYYENSSEIQ